MTEVASVRLAKAPTCSSEPQTDNNRNHAKKNEKFAVPGTLMPLPEARVGAAGIQPQTLVQDSRCYLEGIF